MRVLDPLPAVPARIEPLGPELRRLVPPAPTWEQFACSLNPVRHLEPGERPREWGLDDDARESPPQDPGVEAAGEEWARSGDAELHAPARVDGDELDLSAPLRFKVEFTGTEEYVRLVQEAKALLSHRAPRVTLEEVYLRAMRAFVETLRKQKYGSEEPAGATMECGSVSDESAIAAGGRHDSPSRADDGTAVNETDSAPRASNPRRRGRHIPAAVRRAVAARDHHRCAYVDASGRRCAETQRLEFHHVVPFAFCRSHEVENLTLRCQAHNALAAEQDFGRDLIEERSITTRHESFRGKMSAVAHQSERRLPCPDGAR